MNKEDVMKTVDLIKSLADDYKEALFWNKEKVNTISELEEQLKDKYSTETHVLVEREVLEGLKMDFDELADGFGQLRDTFDEIERCASDISNEAEYHDARSFRETAINCMSKIEDILDPMPEEETDKETV
tara:strand:- start:46 stop:435 length:390 start_codon:yes stop_codon:yes gene_type:complete